MYVVCAVFCVLFLCSSPLQYKPEVLEAMLNQFFNEEEA